MSIPADIVGSRYISLTTFRKDGGGVATPVWHAVNGDELFVVSDAGAWKVKRVRNNSDVVVTVCDIRGKIAPDAVNAHGTARLLDDTGTQMARRLIARKYVLSRMGNWLNKVLHLRRRPVIGIAIRL